MQGHRADGFSLVDLMIGVIVAVILIGAVLSVIIQQGHVRQANTETSLALSACINTLERLRVLDAPALAAMDGKEFDVLGANGEVGGLTPLAGSTLPGQITVLEDQASAGTVLYRVIAMVRWQGVTGRRTYSLQTLMGERK